MAKTKLYTIYIAISLGPFKTHVQNGFSGCYVHAVFELVVHEESNIWTSLPHSFTNNKEGLL